MNVQHLCNVTDRGKRRYSKKKPEPHGLYPLQVLHELAWNETLTSMSRYTKYIFQRCPSNDRFPLVAEYRRFYQQE